jgi:hypothetical protein
VDLTSLAAAAQYSAVGLLTAMACLAVWAFYTGKVHSDREFSKLEAENKALREARDADRARADEVTRAGAVTNQLISALTQVAAERLQPARESAGQDQP